MTVELAKYLKEVLSKYPEKEGWLFPADSESGHTVEVKKQFKRVVEAAGLDPKVITPHIMRHTAISHLVQAGVDLPTVKRISGHHSIQMVERYSHQSGEHIRSAMDKLQYQDHNQTSIMPDTSPHDDSQSESGQPSENITPLHQNYTQPQNRKSEKPRKPAVENTPQTGFEPVTYRLEGGCSIQLSY